ncbi:hypothetical protein BOX15_Mlig031118g3 [Macrostomum lignano]|nr:hypothetical protein BOX15_Mlig031118g2 [Macrostomum lignano]PAA91693.1 hypothetical protein BOX15_Mlig031118g3 [Macrostomum lignano]
MGKKVSGAAVNMEPQINQMKPRKLRKVLDGKLDPNWVSIDRPRQADAAAVGNDTASSTVSSQEHLQPPQSAPDSKLLAHLERIHLRTMRDELGQIVTFDDKTVRLFKSWLMKQAACPVEYLWEDLGALFWPRWIRRGVCSSLSSCSWPPGMKCRKSGQKELKVLRWVCNDKASMDDAQDPRRGSRRRSAHRGVSREERRRRRQRRRGKRRQRRPRRDGRAAAATGAGSAASSSRRGSASAGSRRLPEGWQARKSRRREGLRERRRRRLIMRLSKTVGDYFCYWRQINYYVTDRCACMCS